MPYYVIGVRGSGQGYVGRFGMGGMVDRYLDWAYGDMLGLPPSATAVWSLEYEAGPVSAGPTRWYRSALTGVEVLLRELNYRIFSCPTIRIGLIGYSQGAYVVHRALNMLSEGYRERIRAVLLIADPLAFGPGPEYVRDFLTDGRPGSRLGHGLLGEDLLYYDVWGRSTELCIVGDGVCDARSSSTIWNLLAAALSAGIHTSYGDFEAYIYITGAKTPLREVYGLEFGRRMEQPTLYTSPPPPGAQPVTSLAGLADGTVLQATDTLRVYKLVGGAPIWLSSCANNLCAGMRPTTQAVINTGPAVPRDGATASDEAGNIFKFAGGAPIHLASCAVGCGSPVAITAWSIVNLEHMRPVPVDGTTIRSEPGDIFKFVGGAPVHLSSCSVGCGVPVPISGASIAMLDHMRAFPADGATAIDEPGDIFKFVGGAPVHLSSCSVGCGSPVPITAWSIVNLEHMRPVPVDGATARDEAGNIFKFAGGAPIHLASCAVGCGSPVSITGWSVAVLEHMRAVPEDGTVIIDEPGDVFVFAGGAPLHLASCDVGCDTMTWISGASIINLDHMRPVPADNATVSTETGTTYKFAGGAPLPLLNCTPECGSPVRITQWTVDVREHMNQIPAEGTLMWDTEEGRSWYMAEGNAMLVGTCSGCGVAVNRSSLDGLVDSASAGQAWADFNGDGKADFCRRVGDSTNQRVACTVSTGSGFGATYISGQLDWGYPNGRAWVDMNGDRKADYCRVRGTENHVNALISCTPSTGSGFGGDINSIGSLDWGFAPGRSWADANGDGRADYCRRVGDWDDQRVSCTLSNGGNFTTTIISAPLDWGYDSSQAWVDATGDGKADFCRARGTQNHVNALISCTPSTGSGFGGDVNSIGSFDWGFASGRRWADANGDGRADYCRRVGASTDQRVACTLSNGGNFTTTIISGALDWGYLTGRAWVDASGDGKADFCRVRGTNNGVDTMISCSPSTGGGFGGDINSVGSLDWGYVAGRGWADANGDGKADFCRRVGVTNHVSSYVSCTLSNGGNFTTTITSGVVDWGWVE